ncbi:MAG: hypothetical protein GXO16_07075 [Epsilonproteobacteria bacterium]|nr:hypothetical protein [Campylobacterota bacterium]
MKKESIAGYVSINPYSNEAYLYSKGLVRKTALRFVKKYFYSSFLSTKDFIVARIDLSKNIPEEDLQDVLELKAYEELDLDQTIEYKIDYLEAPTLPSDKERRFYVFVTEYEILEEVFKDVVKQIPYIDEILPAPLLFRTLYTNDILETDATDVFIYFQRHDAFLTIYQNGTYVYSKSLKYSFEDMAERLSELMGKEVSVHEVMNDLAKEGLRIPDLDKLQHYMQIFSELFMHINDVLIYAKRANGIDHIDHIYIGSEVGSIKGIEEYCQTYLAHTALEFGFDYGIDTKEPYVDDLHFLNILTAKDIVEKGLEYPNFSIYPRPAPFFQRPAGKLTLAIAASLAIGAIYPLYNYALGLKYKYEAMELEKEYPKIHAQRVSLESRINKLKKELEEIKKRIALKEEELKRHQDILNAIYDKKVNYVPKSATIADISQDMVAYKLLVSQIENNESKYDFNTTATDDKAITRFIKYISENKSDRYDISTKRIEKLAPDSEVYSSKIEVEVK